MSFGSGGFGGFGSNAQSTFGGFGSGSNTNSGGFGTNTNTSFGSKPFGSGTTGGGLFGSGSTSTPSFGGFGGATNNTSTGFGGSNTSGGLFGQNKTGFGSSTTGGSMFGGGNTSGGFGSNTTGGFGSAATPGFGAGNQNQPNNGTGSTPFSAYQEKEQGGQQQYQTISFQQPYLNYSLEELRVVDYNQGRRHGNQNGQAGAFGQNTGFGGFGSNTNTSTGFGSTTNTGGGLFGSNTNTSSPFGQSNTTTTFGSNTNTSSGGLFGNKPGGLFGSTSTSQPSGGGGLFGSSNTNTGGFGSGGGFGSTSGGGLFGQNNQNQNKPAFAGGFGSNTNANTSNPFGGSTGGFGSNNTSSGGLFGQSNQTSSAPAFGSNPSTSNTGGGLFGNNTSSGGLFGQNNQNQNQNQQSGGLFSGFGQNNQNQQKTGGLFGNTPTSTGGGVFGQSNQNQQSGGLFGNNANQNSGGGIFGNKSTTTGGGIFGSSNQNTGTTGGGLFGSLNTSNQQNQGSSLFGGQNQQKQGGLFGSSTTNSNTGGGTFGVLGQNNNQSTGSSLFSSQNQQQQTQQPSNSLFGASGNSSLLQTSLQINPYGNDALFANIATPTQSPGPLATPLSSSQKTRKSAILPQHKLNPSASNRLLTPQNKRIGGYGFTYSTYGTPSSASSSSSPGYTTSLFGNGSLTKSLGKSLSTSNLRNSYTPEMSILAPGAFSTNGRSFATGSLKKLNINRNINSRPPLFDEHPPDKKRVSFAGTANGTDHNIANGTDTNGSKGNELVLRADPEETTAGEEASSGSTSSTTVNGDAANGTSGRPEMSQVNGKELTPVPENGALAPRTSSSLNKQGSNVVDPMPGPYWSKPSMDELRKMSKTQLSQIKDFVVGRDRIGEIQFNPGKTVDLSDMDLDKLFGDIVQLNHRNATVYGSTTTVPKPALDSGINVFSRITLGNSWPRNKAGKKDQKHLERLKRVFGTTFEQYRVQTGEWVFTVPHFSSYGLDYDGDQYSDDEGDDSESGELSSLPDTPAPLRSSQMSRTPQEGSLVSPTQSSPDDTFDFKKGKYKRASVPGGYGDEVAYEEDEEMDDAADTTGSESFLGQRSVGSLDGQHDADYTEESGSESVEDQDMAGPVFGPVQTTEQPTANSVMPRSILKNSQILRPSNGTPSKGPLVFEDDWANQLQRTISPKKQDRQTLREYQGTAALQERDVNTTQLEQPTNGQAIFSRMEMMESLFNETNKGIGSVAKRAGHGIELPYPKRPKNAHDLNELSAADRDFHSRNKPHFSENGMLVYANKGNSSLENDSFPTVQEPIVGANKDIRFTKLPTFTDAVPQTLNTQKDHTKVRSQDGVPFAKLITDPASLDFADLAKAVTIDTPAGTHEHQAWQLLSILFDETDEVPSDMTHELFGNHKERFRKDKLSEFWEALVRPDAEKHAQQAKSSEEKAIAYLSGHNVPDACYALLVGLDLRLATMVAQIGGDLAMRHDMASQIEEWRRLDVLSEMEEAVRALYELISGNCARSDGKSSDGTENKASTFSIAQFFGLDWRRAFGLRLWYGTLADEPIEWAVAQYADALRDGSEMVKPVPWFVDQQTDVAENREDILWGILKLYASAKMELPANAEDILAPENISGHPLNARLPFQLFQFFKSRQDDQYEDKARKVRMLTVRKSEGLRQSFMSSTTSITDVDEQDKKPLVELGDKLALTYAASLHTPEHWTTAIFVYAHLSSPSMREHYIRSLLTQHSKTYTIADSDATYKCLTRELLIPSTWIHAAAALQAKTDGDYVRQTMHLIKAGKLEDAHEVLCRSVGPDCIISRDYDALRELLGDFVPTPPSSPVDDGASISTRARGRHQKEPVHGWSRGGQIYFDYIHLLDLTSHQSSYRVDEELNREIHTLLSKLQHALEVVARDRWDGCGLEERVALAEIAGIVAGEIIKNKHPERSRVLKLPLTEDLWLRHSTDLSINYYKAVMAAGK